MSTSAYYAPTASFDKSFLSAWNELAPKLRTLIRQIVCSFRVQSWHGQEDDIVEDILQETARRLIERRRKAELGEASPIQVFERMAITIAYNYCQDLRRKECRLVRLSEDTYSPEVLDIMSDRDVVDLSEEATEHLYQEELFALLAREIVEFPSKQRNVLLIDLANRMSFETRPTLLQKAFLNVGIRLQEYQQPLPENTKERSNWAALLYCAYKRMALLVCIQQYTAVV